MSFVVTIAEQNLQFNCSAEQTVLDAALDQGITMSYGCRNGLCGSCKGQLISGQVDYPDGQPGGITEQELEQQQALFCKAVPQSDLTIKVTVLQPELEIETKTLPVRVSSIEYMSDDVIKLILQLPALETFQFKAGQCIYFILRDGRKRAFSLANSPNEQGQLELQIRHAVGGVFTDFVFNQLAEGDLLQIEGPHGTFWFQQDDKPILLVAGGTGFAPIKGIFEELNQQSIDRPVHLFWGSRARKDLYQHNLVQQWQQQAGIDYTPVLSDPDPEDDWQGETGFVHEAVLNAYPDLSDYAVYMAGPPQMIESCKKGFIEAGLDTDSLYYDSFEYSSDALDAMKDNNKK